MMIFELLNINNIQFCDIFVNNSIALTLILLLLLLYFNN